VTPCPYAFRIVGAPAGMDRRTVLRALRRLQDQGFIQTVVKGGLNAGPSRYCVFPSPIGSHEAPRAASNSAGEERCNA
jgi:hypothetical protein